MSAQQSKAEPSLSAHTGGITAEDILKDINGHVHGPDDAFSQNRFPQLRDILSNSSLQDGVETPCTSDAISEPVGSPDKDFIWWFSVFSSRRPKGARSSWLLCCHETTKPGNNSGSAHLFLAKSATLDLSTETGWRDVQVVGQFCGDDSLEYRDGLLVLCGHACRVFASQPTRLFLHGFYICGSRMELWVFDRSGIYSCGSIDMRDVSADIPSLMLSYQLMADKDLGQSTIIKRDDFGNFITLEDATLTGPEKVYLENSPIALSRKLVGDGTVCYRGRASNQGEWKYVVKFKWRRAQDRGEEHLLKLAKQRKVWGVVSLKYHKEIDSTANLRHGLHDGRCRRFPTGGAETIQETHGQMGNGSIEPIIQNTEDAEDFFENRIFTCLILSPAGRSLRTFTSALELVQVFRDTVKAHRSLFQDAQILHQDVSAQNIIINDIGEEHPKGVMIDLDVAMDLGAGPPTPGEVTGTRPFMSIGILKRRQPHRYRHDLESFLYVFLWTVISNRSDNPPRTSRLRAWSRGTWDDSVERKMFDMRKENFRAILDEFPDEFDSLKELAETLRDALFPFTEGQLWTGTDGSSEATNRLYDVMIGAFDAAAISESIKSGLSS